MLPFVLLEAPKTPENSSRSKVGPEVGFGGVPESRPKVYKILYFWPTLKVWVSIKFLSAKFGFTPRKGPKNEGKLYKSVENPPN